MVTLCSKNTHIAILVGATGGYRGHSTDDLQQRKELQFKAQANF